jgi:hypothetical protein
MNLVLIETSGNQGYIFATNKLRENVGASELTYQAGTQYVRDAVQSVGGSPPSDLQDANTYPTIGSSNPVEIILAVSGKALLLVSDADLGKRIVREVTLRALKDAPGLEIRGIVSEAFDFDSQPIHAVIKAVHREYELLRSRLPGPAARFQRLPIVAECASSGLPAARYDGSGRDHGARSAVVLAKRAAAESGMRRIRRLIPDQYRLPYSTTEIEDLGCDWLAIVHADGNGLGQVFLNFDQVAQTSGNRDYITKLRRFSLALNECTEKAFGQALGVLQERGGRLPIVPLVLGGDDLTVICDGRQALRFTKQFLDSLEAETRQNDAINSILKNGVTSCAGVAIVKPHFPFFAGYQLAEELLRSAKKIAKADPQSPVSALDYHILYDASGPDLERIRRELTVDNGQTLLVGRPYVTTANQGPDHRRWSELDRRISAVRAKDDDGRRLLPNSMLHELREGLFLGRAQADARLKLVLERYRSNGLDKLLGNGNSLFWQDNGLWRTALLDAVDTTEFFKDQP